MAKKRKKTRSRRGLQVVTLCISTAMVLVLLGLVVFSVLTARNLSAYVKENLRVTVMLSEDVTNPEAEQMCRELRQRPYVTDLTYISKEEALKELTAELGADPTEFTDGVNPTLASVEMQMKADYANGDSLQWIEKELKKNAKVQEISYPKDLMEQVNRTLAKINFVLLVLAVLLLIISFSLINNSVKLGVYARRFTIHTMKLVGASWGFIRRPFLKRAVVLGFVSALLTCALLSGIIYVLMPYMPHIEDIMTWRELAITAGGVFIFGFVITTLCTLLSVNKFLRMTAGELYKI